MSDLSTWHITVKGVVQGVGFRPFVFTAAKQNGLTGWVRNSSSGVDIIASGPRPNLDAFLSTLNNDPPPLSQIDLLNWEEVDNQVYPEFKILESEVVPGEFIPISSDIAICEDCRKELFDPENHRYRYPFINCTNCGPRLTIIKDIPYDRPLTTMASFPMCSVCADEYESPMDRRFHAQPVACADCGPSVWFEDKSGKEYLREEAIEQARKYLRTGKIIAIKGLGGFHLACDATNAEAVAALRERKKRSEKPFAVMAFDTTAIERFCNLTTGERVLVESKEKPIVIVEQKPNSSLSRDLAPGRQTVGVMLAYTPLHLLLLEPEKDFPEIFVMTSGNISEEPITYTNPDTINRLDDIADGFLLHDRDIHLRVDDSVVAEFNAEPYIFRRARGYAPQAVKLPGNQIMGLAVGAELKNTFCLTNAEYAFISHHIGDLKNFETYEAYVEGVHHYQNIFKVYPQQIACDLHPEYLSTKYANEYAARENIPLFQVQHHHAHLAACLADNGYQSNSPVIGVIFDGTGLGTDGNIWGGEILLGNAKAYERLYHLDEMPLPGGDNAVQNPYRIALAYLRKNQINLNQDLAPLQCAGPTEFEIIEKQIANRINTPMTSSMGRLFDAVASLIRVRQTITYEAQAAIELEQIADPDILDAYIFELSGKIVKIDALLEQIITDLLNGTSKATIAAKFHNGIARLVLTIAREILLESGVGTVALSGGVWQNMFLLRRTVSLLESEGFSVLVHHRVPANDGGISLGQAAIMSAANTE